MKKLFTKPYYKNNIPEYPFGSSKIIPKMDSYLNILNGSGYAGIDISKKISIEDEYRKTCEGWYHADNNQLAPIYRYFASQCDVIAEFGVAVGCSTRGLLAGLPKKYIGVDIYNRTVDSIKLSKMQPVLLKKICKDNNIEFEFFMKNDLLVDIGKVDLLHIDSNHHYEHVIQQLRNNELKVQKYILLHDYNYNPVNTAIRDFLKITKIFELMEIHTYNNGLAILKNTKPENFIVC